MCFNFLLNLKGLNCQDRKKNIYILEIKHVYKNKNKKNYQESGWVNKKVDERTR